MMFNAVELKVNYLIALYLNILTTLFLLITYKNFSMQHLGLMSIKSSE